MREIVLDTETTGLDPASGHRVVEIGCLELKGRIPTGRTFHCYLNPERDMPDEAFRVHGLSTDFLKTHQTFDRVVDDFLHFIADDTLVIHNARFDMKFLNFELTRLDRPALAMVRPVGVRRHHVALAADLVEAHFQPFVPGGRQRQQVDEGSHMQERSQHQRRRDDAPEPSCGEPGRPA